MKKTIALVITLLLTVTLFASCGGATASSASHAAADAPKATNLQVLWFSDGKEGEVFMELAKEYETIHPEVTIELIETPYDEINNKVKNMLAAGAPPALARLSSVGEYKNQLLDLKEYVPSGAAFADNFYEML
ncbi:MAG: sugar ABC transporter substrate-binding protein, partial [Ruthenibacterium sp.]